jgi:hypothetical protein
MGLRDLFARSDPAAEQEYQSLLNQAAAGQTAVLPQLAQLAASGRIAERQLRKLNMGAVTQMADRVLADEILTVDEESTFLEVVEGLGFTQADLNTGFDGVMKQLVLARANDGRLPVAEDHQLMAQRDEIVHGELPAALLKEVARREFRGGGAGMSFRIAKGVRIHTGGMRGRSVVVGTQIQTADTGVLSITNKRVVFIGARKTIESKYAKLVGVQVYSDAISLSVSNRQNASLFQVDDGPYTAALINAAAQQEL